jgi:two-component system sensor histidine kinase YesM
MPVIVIQVVSYYDIADKLQKKIDALENTNLVQTRKIIRTKLDFYEDLLYQMYTDDRIIDLVNKVNGGENVEFNSGQLRRALHSYAYALPYVQSIVVLTSSRRTVFDDLLTGYNTKTSWLDVAGGQPSRLYQSVIEGNETRVFPTQLASFYAPKKYYLFHLAHRLIDYKDIWIKNGVIILSIDERMLSEICDERPDQASGGTTEDSIFILSGDGTVVSYPDKSAIGKRLDLPADPTLRSGAIKRMVSGGGSGPKRLSLYELPEAKTGWSIIAARNLGALYQEISGQQRITIVVVLSSVAVLFAIIFFITGRLTRSIRVVVAAMNAAAAGDLSGRIANDKAMPLEIDEIAANFNRMIAKIGALLEEVQAASTKQRNAEIAALEAQVNPHFLYNTLDMINWMAIDRNEFEISNAISTLAEIFRYGIDNSNGIVEIEQEVAWLRNYIFLQQTRLKGSFEFKLDLDPAARACHIHKLLFQPFVENAIFHGFRGVEGKRELAVSIAREDTRIRIVITDNGKGISETALRDLESKPVQEPSGEGHIGMRAAIARIKMYYGNGTRVEVEGAPGGGTRVRIDVPAA